MQRKENLKQEFNLKEIELGAYYPGVYIIKLNKTFHENMQYDEFSKQDWQTFIHEYVHFLQDISTGRGYLYFQHKAQLMNLCFYVLQKDKDNEIRLPLMLEETGIKDAFEKTTLLQFYEGDSSLKKIHHINRFLPEKDVIASEVIFPEKNIDLYSFNFYVDDSSIPYTFGNLCIAESMAYLIERCLFGAEERKNELPYNSCELVCKLKCPELLGYKDKIVKICEVSLMHDDCAKYFCGLVDMCREYKAYDFSDESFDEFCKKNIDAQWREFDMAFKKAIDGIDILFPEKFPYTFVVNMQLKALLECGHNYRAGRALFISDVFGQSNPTYYFQQLIDLMPFPMIIDGNGDFYGSEGMQNLPVAQSVLSLLLDRSDVGCALKEYCKKSKLENYDEWMCTESPWSQCKKEGVCPLAVYFLGYRVDKLNYTWRYKE